MGDSHFEDWLCLYTFTLRPIISSCLYKRTDIQIYEYLYKNDLRISHVPKRWDSRTALKFQKKLQDPPTTERRTLAVNGERGSSPFDLNSYMIFHSPDLWEICFVHRWRLQEKTRQCPLRSSTQVETSL